VLDNIKDGIHVKVPQVDGGTINWYLEQKVGREQPQATLLGTRMAKAESAGQNQERCSFSNRACPPLLSEQKPGA